METAVIDKLLRLAALSLEPQERAQLDADLDKIVAFIDAMQVVDTDGVEPLAHPLEDPSAGEREGLAPRVKKPGRWAMAQPLRTDRITETVCRETFQESAPEARDGLYLVPRVVE